MSKLTCAIWALYGTEDFKEGRAAEAEGRRPSYRGNDRLRCPDGSSDSAEASISCRSGLLCERGDGHTPERPRSQGAVVRHQFQFRANLRTTSAYQIMNRKCETNMACLSTMDADRALAKAWRHRRPGRDYMFSLGKRSMS